MRVRRCQVVGVFLLASAWSCASDELIIEPRDDYRGTVAKLTDFIDHEMRDKALPALSIALVDDQTTVWARGFGYADPVDSVPATAATVYRVGSVSKLFTDLAIMQLVERGELDLDAPITDYLPDLRFQSVSGAVPTIRQLTSHRAGVVREPPVGHYFDASGATLAATVASLNGTTLVYEPERRVKYSNAGIATVGYVLEHTQQRPFADYVARAVLHPLGMDRSGFAPNRTIRAGLAHAYMWTYDGRRFEAPTFELGMAPAGSMYAPVTDLAKFMSAVFAGGVRDGQRVLDERTLDTMLTPQFAPGNATTGYGIGFRLSMLDGDRRIGHGGAIYGFATELGMLPDHRVGAVSVTTLDGANAVVTRITDYALRLMRAVQDGRPLPEPETTGPIDEEAARRLSGGYGRGADRVEVLARKEHVTAYARGRRHRLRAHAGGIVSDDPLGFGLTWQAEDSAVVLDGRRLERLEGSEPPPPPDRWNGLIGEYGWDYNTLYIYERDGVLTALIEWFFIDPLRQIDDTTFAFPDDQGLYHGEKLVFGMDETGRATEVVAAGIVFERRNVGTEAGVTFAIDPVRPVPELRAAALAATPPVETGSFREPDLVELRSLDSTIAYDIRYATANNFMGAVFYDAPRAFLQRPAAEALVRAHETLREQGYGLLIHDAYRPWYVTKMFWDATPSSLKMFVADPSSGSRHNRGAAVDLTLYSLATGAPVHMVSGYDEFSDRAFPEYPGGTSRQRWHRELLRNAMEAQGYDVYEFEWWHFDYRDWREYPLLNTVFEDLAQPVSIGR